MPNRPFRCFVFDWDGTLLDSIGAIVNCVQATLAELGESPASEASIRASIGLGLRETVEMFRPGCDDELFEQVVEAYGRLWAESFSHAPVLFEGVRPLLGELSRRGHLLAIATAKSRAGLEHDLERTGLGDLFLSTRTVSEAPSKPDPWMLLDIMEELGAASGESLMVGDTVHDLAMAANAGVGSVAVLSGCESRESLEPWRPLACLESVAEMLDWLDERA